MPALTFKMLRKAQTFNQIRKGGDHDQKEHGNWSDGGGGVFRELGWNKTFTGSGRRSYVARHSEKYGNVSIVPVGRGFKVQFENLGPGVKGHSKAGFPTLSEAKIYAAAYGRTGLQKHGEHNQEDHGNWAEGSSGGGASTESSWEKPSRAQLDRAHKVYSQLTDGAVASYIDRQMRGGVLKDGRFKEFTPGQKQSNLKRIKEELDRVRSKDPEAFEVARQWSLAEQFGVENYKDIPDTVTVYRGHSDTEKNWKMVNVTTKREVAENFGAGGAVTAYQVNKADIGFTLHGSSFDEGELLVFDSRKLKVTEKKLSESAVRRQKLAAITPGESVKLEDGRKGVLLNHGVGMSAIVKLPDGSIDYAAYIQVS